MIRLGGHRLREVLTTYQGAAADTIVTALSTTVHDFDGGVLADDVCIIACRATLQ